MGKKLLIVTAGSLFAFLLLVSLTFQDILNAKPKEAEKGKLFGVKLHCRDRSTKIEKVRAETYDDAVKKAIEIAKKDKCKDPENMQYFQGSYECQAKKKWSVSYKVWAVNSKHVEQMRDEKIHKKKGKVKCDAAGGGSSSIVGEANSDFALKNAKDDWDWK